MKERDGETGAFELYRALFERWDPMFFNTVDPTRGKRTEWILRALRACPPGPLTVLDLGCGPGTLTARVLESLPNSRVVAVDTDPVLLRVGAKALHRFHHRTEWVLADLREEDWTLLLPRGRFGAAVSSLALHWLEAVEVRSLYESLHSVLRPGGLVVNADFLPSGRPSGSPKTAQKTRMPANRRSRIRAFKAEWRTWWEAVENEPSMHEALEERQVRLPGKLPPRRTTGPRTPVSLEANLRAMRDAGFRASTARWHDRGFHVLIGRR